MSEYDLDVLEAARKLRVELKAAGERLGSELLDELRADRAEPAILPGETTKPSPPGGAQPVVWQLVKADMDARDFVGRQRYGKPLYPHEGRDMMREAYEEILDAAVYLRTALYERDGK